MNRCLINYIKKNNDSYEYFNIILMKTKTFYKYLIESNKKKLKKRRKKKTY